jgi:hypothetical protein
VSQYPPMQPPQPPPGGGWDSGGWQQAPPGPGQGQAWTPPPQQPAPGPQGWQTQPAGYGAPPPGVPGGPPVAKQSRGPVIWIALGAVVVAAAAGAYFAFFAGGSDSGPAAAVRTYYNAAVDGDCDTMVDHIDLDAAGAPRATVLEQCQQLYEGDAIEEQDIPTSLDEVKVISETDSTAKVSATYTTDEGSDTEEVNLNKVDGDWKIDLGSLSGENPEDTTTTTGTDDSTTTTAEETTTTADETTTTTATPSTTVAAEGTLTPPPLDDPEAEDAAKAQLATDCGGGNMTACDDLYWASDFGGELEAYAKSCGGLVPTADASDQCVTRFGEQVAAG